MGAEQSQGNDPSFSDRLSQWSIPPHEAVQLPVFTPSTLATSASTPSPLLLAVAGVVYDLSSFADDHPGGREVLDAFVGRDATDTFIESMHPYEEVWEQMKDMRVGILRGEEQQEQRSAVEDAIPAGEGGPASEVEAS